MNIRPVWVEVDLEAIKENISSLKNLIAPSALFMAVVKANAYGHGAVEVARVALEGGAERLGVVMVEEALELKEAGITQPIHLLAEPPVAAIPLIVKEDIIPAVYSLAFIRALNREAAKAEKRQKVHVKLDTGMNRVGLPIEQVENFFSEITSLSNLEVEGIFTHFALADNPQSDFTLIQLERFLKAVKKIEAYTIIPLKHVANSGAAIFFPQTHLDMVRVGIALYGLHPSRASKGKINLKPALSWKTKISYLKTVPAGQGISYGHSFVTNVETRIATLPVGYADGYTRLLSNRCHVLIKGKRCPAIGTICMDQFMVDVTSVNGVEAGDEVVLIGKQGNEEITADELAEILGTINYEIVCKIDSRIPRIYLRS